MTWLALNVPTVRRGTIADALHSVGVDWDDALHVTATGSLAREIRREDGVALPLKLLMDLLHVQASPIDWQLDLDEFPNPQLLRSSQSDKDYNDQLAKWQSLDAGRAIRLRLAFDEAVRNIAGTGVLSPDESRVLRRNRRVLFDTVREAAAYGADPSAFQPSSGMERAFARIWPDLELRLPLLAQPRLDLWRGQAAVRQRTPSGRDLERRVRNTLELAFGASNSTRTIVYHGFYYYGPDQWAWFQLLRELPGVSQIFVVQDDGKGATTETWRRFFNQDREMPSYRPIDEIQASVAGLALRAAAQGVTVDPDTVGAELRVVRCDNVPQFVRLWNQRRSRDLEENRQSRTYAAAAGDVGRSIERLVPSIRTADAELRNLPAGRFFLAAHRCLVPDAPGTYRIDPLSIVEMADSQFLGPVTPDEIAALRRTMPYFERCTSDGDWLDRASRLTAMKERLGDRDTERSSNDNDIDRIRKASISATRLVPWADLTNAEVQRITTLVHDSVAAVRHFGESQNVSLREHLDKMWGYLKSRWRSIPQDQREELLTKLRAFSRVTDQPLALEGMVDMVSMLLGASMASEPGEHQQGDAVEIRDLRGLDALGYRPVEQSLHLANMSDRLFPNQPVVAPWPFTESGFASALVLPEALELLRLRRDTAGLSDLYLLWLALNEGVSTGGVTTISWIVEQGGKTCGLTPLVAILTRLSGVAENLAADLGGIPIEAVPSTADLPAVATRPIPAVFTVQPTQLARSVAQIEPWAIASAEACPRRFALQWALGPSGSFQMRHHQALLYGNTLGRLIQTGMPTQPAIDTARAIWAYLTAGEQATSLSKSRVLRTPKRSAAPAWTLTLGGSKDGRSPIDRAYQRAKAKQRPAPAETAGQDWGVLPPGSPSADVCRVCPVRPSCLVWTDPAEESRE